MTRPRPPAPLALALALAANADARQAHFDVHVSVEQGRLATGGIDVDSGMVVPGVRAFAGEFGEFMNGTNDPGFVASAGTFTQGTLVAFDILDALRKWDGEDFDAIPTERLTISLGVNSRQTPIAGDELVDGFNFVQAGAGGGFHQHINFFLGSPASMGVYLLKLRLRVSAGADPSDPFYIVFNQNDAEENHDAAIEYVETVLLAPPPCIGDANGDGTIDFADITGILIFWGTPGPPGDANHDGEVNFTDITTVLTRWGLPCP